MKQKIKEVLVTLAVTAGLMLALAGIHSLAMASAKADGAGCETIQWGFLGSQRRSICDLPKRPDGSWLRAREVWVPEGWVPVSTYCSRYSCSSSGGYYRPKGTVAFETYIVFDYNVLPGEPPWMPPGHLVIR